MFIVLNPKGGKFQKKKKRKKKKRRSIWEPIGFSSKKGQKHRAVMNRRANIMRKRLPIHQAIALDLVRKICNELNLGWAKSEKPLFARMNRRWYLSDIFIPSLKLIIEIDGSSHEDDNSKQYDRVRDAVLSGGRGISTVRFKNEEVTQPDFREKIIKALTTYREKKASTVTV